MIFEKFPNEFLDVLLTVVSQHQDSYQIVSTKPDGEGYTEIEVSGIDEPFDLLGLGIRIGMEQSDRVMLGKFIPTVMDIVQKDREEKIKPSDN